MRARCGLWMVVPIDRSIDRSMDRSIDESMEEPHCPEGERGRQLGTRSAPICRGGCQSLSMLRDRSRVKGKKTRQGRLSIGIVERIPVPDHWKTYWIRFKAESQPRGAPSLGRLATFLAVSWYTHRCLFSIRYADPRLKNPRQLSKWRIQVALVHEIGLAQTLDRPGKLPASDPSVSENRRGNYDAMDAIRDIWLTNLVYLVRFISLSERNVRSIVIIRVIRLLAIAREKTSQSSIWSSIWMNRRDSYV